MLLHIDPFSQEWASGTPRAVHHDKHLA
jgi:hypothetical protein